MENSYWRMGFVDWRSNNTKPQEVLVIYLAKTVIDLGNLRKPDTRLSNRIACHVTGPSSSRFWVYLLLVTSTVETKVTSIRGFPSWRISLLTFMNVRERSLLILQASPKLEARPRYTITCFHSLIDDLVQRYLLAVDPTLTLLYLCIRLRPTCPATLTITAQYQRSGIVGVTDQGSPIHVHWLACSQ